MNPFPAFSRWLKPRRGPGNWRHLPFGVNIIGYLEAEMGVGEAARSTIRACQAAGIPFSLVDFAAGSRSRAGERLDPAWPRGQQFGVNILHINADQTPVAVRHFGAGFFRDHYTIGVWNWELPEFPVAWRRTFDSLDEVWAPSVFCRDAFAAATAKPVTCIPYSVVPAEPPAGSRAGFTLPPGFLFLFMFDALSIPERKNPLGLLDAFALASETSTVPLALALKVINGGHESAFMTALRARVAGRSDIVLMDDYLPRERLTALFAACDSYISLHRSEGFGLTLAEAMALGKPVIATNWSANVDFMHGDNAVLVDYRLVKLGRDHGPYRAGSTWAEPDVKHAAACMCRVAEDASLRLRLGTAAAAHIRNVLSPLAVGQAIQKRLAALRG